MPGPNNRVNDAFKAYETRLKKEGRLRQGPMDGSLRGTREEFLQILIEKVSYDLYIVDLAGESRKLDLRMEEAEQKDRELSARMEKELDNEEYKRWKREGGGYTHRAQQLEKLYALDDQGFEFIRMERDRGYEFVHFHAGARNDPDSYGDPKSIGRARKIEALSDTENYERSSAVAASIMRSEEKIEPYVPGDLPEKEPGGFSIPYFEHALVPRHPHSELDDDFRRKNVLPEMRGGTMLESEYVVERARRGHNGLRSYKDAYIADKDLTQCYKLELDWDWEDDKLGEWLDGPGAITTYGESDSNGNYMSKADVLARMDRQEELLDQINRLKKQGFRIIKSVSLENGEKKALLSTSDNPFHFGARKLLEPKPVKPPGSYPWFKILFARWNKKWARDVEQWNKQKKRYDEYRSDVQNYKKELEELRPEAEKAAQCIEKARQAEAVETASLEAQEKELYPNSRIRDPEAFVKTFSEVTLQGFAWEEKDQVQNDTYLVPTEKTAEGRRTAKQQALTCLREIRGGSVTETLDELEKSLMFYNLCFRKSSLTDRNAADSSKMIRKGMELIEKLQRECGPLYKMWVENKITEGVNGEKNTEAKDRWERIYSECKGALILADYAAARKDSLDAVLKTEPDTPERSEALKNLLVPHMFKRQMNSTYRKEHAAVSKTYRLTVDALSRESKAMVIQEQLGESDPRMNGIQELHNTYGNIISQTTFFTTAEKMSKEALAAVLVSPEGKLRSEPMREAANQFLERRAAVKKAAPQQEARQAGNEAKSERSERSADPEIKGIQNIPIG